MRGMKRNKRARAALRRRIQAADRAAARAADALLTHLKACDVCRLQGSDNPIARALARMCPIAVRLALMS